MEIFNEQKFDNTENEALNKTDISGSLPKSEVIEVFQKLKDAINDKGCCGNAQLIGSIVWNAFDKFGGNDR